LHETADDDTAADHPRILAAVEFREILKRRRMVRAYEDESIPREALERIVATVLRAPSGGFSQGHRLYVVTEPERRTRIAELFGEASSIAEGREPWIGAAPALVVVGTREDSYHERYRRADKLQEGQEIDWPVPYWHVDAGAAMMLILLAAIDEGYAAGVFGVPVEHQAAFKQLLSIPDDVAVVACVTIGKPADDGNWSAVSSRLTQARKPLDELVRWE
jgi:FMN reductase [NAD(P)H]